MKKVLREFAGKLPETPGFSQAKLAGFLSWDWPTSLAQLIRQQQ